MTRIAMRALAAALAIFAPVLAAGTARAQDPQLSSALVGRVISQAVQESRARGVASTIAVVDRVGNVLAVYQMAGTSPMVRVSSGRGLVATGLEGVDVVPATIAAISKAITGAYLSTRGNAFTTRTASQIVQEHFLPGEQLQASGPLFGVQFSSLPCSDLNVRAATNSNSGTVSATIGPKRSPLGLSADPGGIPLYILGQSVGAIGVISDGIYGLDLNVFDVDTSNDELIALAGTVGFEPPVDIRADRITVGGRTLRFTDQGTGALRSNPGAAPAFAAINGNGGSLVSVNGYISAAQGLKDGVVFGTPASGYRPDGGVSFTERRAFVLVDGNNNPRFPPRNGTDGPGFITAQESREILEQALGVALRGRAQIRIPRDSPIEVTISVVDTNGVVLGIVRTPDGPVFGTDVSLQKARTANFFSYRNAGVELASVPRMVFSSPPLPVPLDSQNPTVPLVLDVASYVDRTRAFFGRDVLNGSVAFSMRAIGSIARPFYPDGIQTAGPGPLAQPFNRWSPFAVGLQLDLVLPNIAQHILFVIDSTQFTDTPATCTALPAAAPMLPNRVANGIQFFSGGYPIYRGRQLVGSIGISGDGVDQDSLISFFGLYLAGLQLNSGIQNAPMDIRSDQLTPGGARLRYVSCPFQPFVGGPNEDVCEGK